MAVRRPATAAKKLGLESSAKRAVLLDATERLIREKGFAAITTRNVAAEAGLKPQLIHYYFASMDALYVEVFRRGAEAELERIAAVAGSPRPLQALWRISRDSKATRFITEFMALANHNAALRAEIRRHADQRRELQADVIGKHLAAQGLGATIPPMVIAILMEQIARGIVLETSLDITLGRDETEGVVRAWLQRFDGEPG
jgi:AcrR family transcriptional regulator